MSSFFACQGLLPAKRAESEVEAEEALRLQEGRALPHQRKDKEELPEVPLRPLPGCRDEALLGADGGGEGQAIQEEQGEEEAAGIVLPEGTGLIRQGGRRGG